MSVEKNIIILVVRSQRSEVRGPKQITSTFALNFSSLFNAKTTKNKKQKQKMPRCQCFCVVVVVLLSEFFIVSESSMWDDNTSVQT